MKIKKKFLRKIRCTLLDNIGDHRICPLCDRTIFIKDQTQAKTLLVYKELEKIMDSKK